MWPALPPRLPASSFLFFLCLDSFQHFFADVLHSFGAAVRIYLLEKGYRVLTVDDADSGAQGRRAGKLVTLGW